MNEKDLRAIVFLVALAIVFPTVAWYVFKQILLVIVIAVFAAIIVLGVGWFLFQRER